MEHEQIEQRQKNTSGKGMRSEPSRTSVGNGTDKTFCGCAPETAQLAEEYAEGVG
jgi:hypothetical protein